MFQTLSDTAYMSAMYHVPGRYHRGGDCVAGVGEQQPSQHGRHVQAHLGHIRIVEVSTGLRETLEYYTSNKSKGPKAANLKDEPGR